MTAFLEPIRVAEDLRNPHAAVKTVRADKTVLRFKQPVRGEPCGSLTGSRRKPRNVDTP
jgi:hypothetical protein